MLPVSHFFQPAIKRENMLIEPGLNQVDAADCQCKQAAKASMERVKTWIMQVVTKLYRFGTQRNICFN